MLYIIDGYNLFFRCEKNPNPFEETRATFLETFAGLVAKAKLDVCIILDGNPGISSHSPIQRELGNVEILYSPTGLDADTYIIEYLSTRPSAREITVVSSDREVQREAKNAGAHISSIKSFLSLIKKKAKKHSKRGAAELEKFVQNDALSHDRWLSIFEKRLKDKDE